LGLSYSSSPKKEIHESHNVNLFLIPFQLICDFLADHDIAFDWGEKDRDQARESWDAYLRLSNSVQAEIGSKMVDIIAAPLSDLIAKVLDPEEPRELERVDLELHTNLGEVMCISCADVEEAIGILQDFDFDVVFDDSNGIALTDPPPLIED